MRFARIAHPEGMCFAVVERDGDGGTGSFRVREIQDTPFTPPRYTGRTWGLTDVRLLAPILPSKICAMGRTYSDHVKEMYKADTSEVPPALFLKPPTSVVGPLAPITIPSFATNVECEAELAVVVKRPCKNVKADDWKDVVLGVTIVNDVTSRDLQKNDPQWTRAKGLDTFCPLGPWIETDIESLDLEELPIRASITRNGETSLKQDSSTAHMVMSIGEMIEFISASMTLLPGDVICTGSPAGTAQMLPGDTVTVEIPGIGRLVNPVKAA